MSEADQFRQYAQEAMRRAGQAKTEKEKRSLLELARTWSQAALESDSTVMVNVSPPQHRAANERTPLHRHSKILPGLALRLEPINLSSLGIASSSDKKGPKRRPPVSPAVSALEAQESRTTIGRDPYTRAQGCFPGDMSRSDKFGLRSGASTMSMANAT